MTHHVSTVYVPDVNTRLRKMRSEQVISKQFRFVVRQAVACAEARVDYTLDWRIEKDRAMARFEAIGAIPTAKKLPAPREEKPVAEWKPRLFDASYSLAAACDGNSERWIAGFAVDHSSGLRLVRPGESESGELESADGVDVRAGWWIVHQASGKGFGLTLNFDKARRALLAAAAKPVDWTKPLDDLAKDPEFRRAGNEVLAEFGRGGIREQAKWKLEQLAA
jgi:hypothetical protein